MSSQPCASGCEAAAQTALDGIGAQARRSNLARVRLLSAALTRWRSGELTLLERQRSVEVAHQLVGSAGTFGYQRVSALGRQLESFFSSGGDPNAVQFAEAAQALASMQEDLASTGEVAGLS